MNNYNYNNIKEWYKATYKDDELGDCINDVSWSDLWAGLCKGTEVYDILGVGDSVVRERVFEELADILECDYNVVYCTWLGEYQKALQSLMI